MIEKAVIFLPSLISVIYYYITYTFYISIYNKNKILMIADNFIFNIYASRLSYSILTRVIILKTSIYLSV
jgi:hypothetical protein